MSLASLKNSFNDFNKKWMDFISPAFPYLLVGLIVLAVVFGGGGENPGPDFSECMKYKDADTHNECIEEVYEEYHYDPPSGDGSVM